jgi:hypothetical protein
MEFIASRWYDGKQHASFLESGQVKFCFSMIVRLPQLYPGVGSARLYAARPSDEPAPMLARSCIS